MVVRRIRMDGRDASSYAPSQIENEENELKFVRISRFCLVQIIMRPSCLSLVPDIEIGARSNV